MSSTLQKIRFPALLIGALLILLGMLRLGVWQLDRASVKQGILDKVTNRSSQSIVPLTELDELEPEEHRFRKVSVRGQYIADKTVFVDNHVHNGQVGYLVFTPFQLSGERAIMVNRGWVSVGESRDILPRVDTPIAEIELSGRLNLAPKQPPLWDEAFSVNQGAVWAYLPLKLYAQQMQLNLPSLVLELAPEGGSGSQFKVAWADINDEWVAKHQGYAFQWFAMALAFLIACLILVIRRLNRISE